MHRRSRRRLANDLPNTAIKILAILFVVVMPLPVLAWPPTYGAEFSFTNETLLAADYGPNGTQVVREENKEARNRMLEHLRELCASAGCHVPEVANSKDINLNDSYRIEFKDGWWFDVSLDPGVVEVQTRPSTLKEYQQGHERLDLIFEAAKRAGLNPHPEAGGGHIHIGDESTFAGNDRLFRNFLVDLVNHPEVVSGIFGKDLANSIPINSLPKSLKKNFDKIIAAFDAGTITSRHEIARRINKHVYRSLPFPFDPRTESKPNKYRAINVVRMDPAQRFFSKVAARTLELRLKRAQMSAGDFLRQIELFDRRLHLLHEQKRDIRLSPPRGFGDFEVTADDYLRFQNYIVESGLEVERFEDLIPSQYLVHDLKARPGVITEANQERGEFARFAWFRRLFGAKKKPNGCRELFQD